MVDKNSSDNENEFEDNFEDEFEFEDEIEGKEGAAPTSTSPTPSLSHTIRKFLLPVVVLGVIGVTGYLGYKFFSAPSKKTQVAATSQSFISNVGKAEKGGQARQARQAGQAGQVSQPEKGAAQKTSPSTLSEKEVSDFFGTPKSTTTITTTTTSTSAGTTTGTAPATGVTATTGTIAAPGTITIGTPATGKGTETGTIPPASPGSSISSPITTPGIVTGGIGGISGTGGTNGMGSTGGTDVSSPTGAPPTAMGSAPKASESGTQVEQALQALQTAETAEVATKIEGSTPSPHSPPPLSSGDVQLMTQQINKTLEVLSKLNQQMENNLNQIKYLDAYTREVSLTVEKLNAQVTAMDNRIQSLTNLANSVSKDLSKVRNEVGYVKRVISDEGLDISAPPPTARRRSECLTPLEENLDGMGGRQRIVVKGGVGCGDCEYVLHAVIPGRAWLKTAKGQIITITEGETLGNYGKVLVIDAANGVVLTSTGVTFR